MRGDWVESKLKTKVVTLCVALIYCCALSVLLSIDESCSAAGLSIPV